METEPTIFSVVEVLLRKLMNGPLHKCNLKVKRLHSHLIEALGVKGLSIIVEPHFCGVNNMLGGCLCVEGLAKVSQQIPYGWQNLLC